MSVAYQRAVGLANFLVLAVLLWIGLLHYTNPQAYYLAVQEDEFIEWTTYAAFLGAALLHWVECLRRADDRTAFWFLAGVGVFCLFVAGEELSWGQRLLGWRAPEYFLEHNFQQELNLHNVVAKQSQAWLFVLVIMGYGLVLPLLATSETAGKWSSKLGIIPPPIELSPAFFAGVVLFCANPWERVDEVAELMWGICFLLAPILRMLARGPLPRILDGSWQQPMLIANIFIALFASGLTMAQNSMALEATPHQLESFERRRTLWELDKLGRDFQHVTRQMTRELAGERPVNSRVAAFARKFDVNRLYFGKFSVAADSEGEKNRASFFLDPWNTPYWVVMTGNGPHTTTTVYSLGLNHRLDSVGHKMLGDDIGITVSSRD
jgi:hypothetical protein